MAKQNDGFFRDASDFFASDQRVEKIVSCPEMKPNQNGSVRQILVRSMSGREKVALDLKQWDRAKAAGDPERFRTEWFQETRPFELVAISCYTLDGTKIFEQHDIEKLKDLNPKTFARLLQAAQEVNGDDANELKLSGKAVTLSLNGDGGSESPTLTVIGASADS